MLYLGGFLLGFLGSLHCVGMCGPIALALPWKSASQAHFVWKQIFYFLFKALAYMLLGFLSGLLGDTFRFFGFQQTVSIVLGSIMLILGISTLFQFSFIKKMTILDKVFAGLRTLFGKFLKSERPASFMAIGFLNGFLPCGFVYIGLASAVVTNSVLNAGVFMFFFGIGTIPALLTASLLPRFLRTKQQLSTRKLIPLFSILFAILFILRGLNLGIPFVSPRMQGHTPKMEKAAHVECCK
jgi:hypothetical protein